MRRSTKVALVLLGTAGVVGVATAIDAWQRARETGPATAGAPLPEPEAAPVSAQRTYANNEHVPGAGYYHAPFFGWFPFPWNFHDPARGYFAGGQWRNAPAPLERDRSQPSPAAVTSALAAQQARRAAQEQQRRTQTSGFSSGSRSSGSFFSSRPSSSPSSSKPSVLRGGFGSSSRGSSS